MENQELQTLLKAIESDRVERKAAPTERDKIREAICAFANDLPNHRQPGVVFIGANDDGTCSNLVITDKLLRDLANIRDEGNILPFPLMTVHKKAFDECEMAVIIVDPSDAPPVRVRGRTWIRVGPRRAIATIEEERRLTEKRRGKNLPYDIWPWAPATLDDLDLDLFRKTYLPLALAAEVLDQNRRSDAQKLASLRCLTIEEQPRPTVLGVLLLGKDPRQYFPGAYVQFLRIEGMELTDPIKDQKEIDGPLPDLLRILDETLKIHISVAANVTNQSIEVRHPDYPLVALQQLARNAVLHRTYEATNAPVRIIWFSDRIEIQSPGGAFGQVNRDNFGQPGVTDYRNPHIAEAMKNLGYVQRFGMGIPLALKALNENGNPPPEFNMENGYVLVVLRKRA